MLLILAYFIPLISLSFMFLILFTGNRQGQTNSKYFQIFLLSLVTWLGLLFIADQLNNTHSLPFLKLALFVGSFAPALFFIFCQQFAGRSSKILTTLFFLTSSIFALTSVTGLMVDKIEKGTIGVHIVNASPAYFLQTIYTIVAFIVSLLWLRLKARSAGDKKTGLQIRNISIGLTLATLVGAIGSAVNTSGTNLLSPLSVTLFAAAIFFVVFKHGLFDIRGFVVRAAAYFMAFSVLALLYVVPAIVLTGIVLNAQLNPWAYFVLVIITLVTSLLFQPLRLGFNKFTNKFFYRDYYEPQDVLDKISKLLAASVNLDEIEHKSGAIMASTLKPTFTKYLLKQDCKPEDEGMLQLLNKYHKDVVVADSLAGDTSQKLKQVLDDKDIALSLRLKTTHEVMGYLLLGFKQSGSPYSNSDLRLLNTVADETAIGLQNALRFEEIRRFNQTLEQKIQDATKQLRNANLRLKELDKTKDEFISMASHQLRTPLTTIKGYLSMILDGDAVKGKIEQRDMIQQAFDSSQNMVDLIADLLNVSRLQSGKFVIDNKPTDLADLIDHEIKKLSEQASKRNLKLIYDKPASIPILSLDAVKMRQVVMNFIDNAIYYTPPGGSIRVALEASPHSVEYTVTDTGVGVPKEVQHHLFSKFYRAANAKKMRPDGTGLGLFMAKKVIVAQGGALIFKSVEGKGSTFGFSFPRSTTEVKK